MKWFKLTENKKTYEKHTVVQIKYTKDILGLRTKGKLGGWIENESNLSSDSPVFIDPESIIYGENTRIDTRGNAITISSSIIGDFVNIDCKDENDNVAFSICNSVLSGVSIYKTENAKIFINNSSITGKNDAIVNIRTTNGMTFIYENTIKAYKDITIENVLGQMSVRESEITNACLSSFDGTLDISAASITTTNKNKKIKINQAQKSMFIRDSVILADEQFSLLCYDSDLKILETNIITSDELEWRIKESSTVDIAKSKIEDKISLNVHNSKFEINDTTIKNNVTLGASNGSAFISFCEIDANDLKVIVDRSGAIFLFQSKISGNIYISSSNKLLDINYCEISGNVNINTYNRDSKLIKSFFCDNAKIEDAKVTASTIKGDACVYNTKILNSSISGNCKIGYFYRFGKTNVLQNEFFDSLCVENEDDFIIFQNEFFKEEYLISCRVLRDTRKKKHECFEYYYLRYNKIQKQLIFDISSHITNAIDEIMETDQDSKQADMRKDIAESFGSNIIFAAEELAAKYSEHSKITINRFLISYWFFLLRALGTYPATKNLEDLFVRVLNNAKLNIKKKRMVSFDNNKALMPQHIDIYLG